MDVDFGKTASDYTQYRAGFPSEFFDRLRKLGLITTSTRLLDLGTGTGTLARGFAQAGAKVTGIDISENMLLEAQQLDHAAGIEISYTQASAESTGFESASFDVITAGQCWHWFDRVAVVNEVKRLLIDGGYIIIAHFDWLPVFDNVVTQTEQLIKQYNQSWNMGGGNGFYPMWLTDLKRGGFQGIESFSFDVQVEYSHLAWRGRIRASAGVGASLSAPKITAFDRDLNDLLKTKFPEDPLKIPHRVFTVIGTR